MNGPIRARGVADMTELIERIARQGVVEIDPDGLEALLGWARIVRDEDTRLSGRIRVIAVGGAVLVQEQTPRGVLLVRRIATVEAAERLVDDRLATYERMWDGCGCKVDYYGPA